MHHSVQPIRSHIGWTLRFHRPAAQRFCHDRLDFHCVRLRTAGRSDAKRPADVRSACGIGWTIGPGTVQRMPHAERTSATILRIAFEALKIVEPEIGHDHPETSTTDSDMYSGKAVITASDDKDIYL